MLQQRTTIRDRTFDGSRGIEDQVHLAGLQPGLQAGRARRRRAHHARPLVPIGPMAKRDAAVCQGPPVGQAGTGFEFRTGDPTSRHVAPDSADAHAPLQIAGGGREGLGGNAIRGRRYGIRIDIHAPSGSRESGTQYD